MHYILINDHNPYRGDPNITATNSLLDNKIILGKDYN